MRKANPGQLEFDFQPTSVKIHRQKGDASQVEQRKKPPSPQKYEKRNTLEMGEKLRDGLRGEYIVFKSCGHIQDYEQPIIFQKVVELFDNHN